MTQPTNRRLVTEAKLATDLAAIDAADVGAVTPADLATGLATKVNSSTYTTGLAGKQDVATLAAASVAAGLDVFVGQDTVSAQARRENPARWQQSEGLSTLTSSGLTETAGKIAATVGGTDGTAVMPLWGTRREMRASAVVTATKSTAGSKSYVGFTVSQPGILPTGTGPTTAGVFGVGYIQGSGICIVRENVSTPLVVVADSAIADGTEYRVSFLVDRTLALKPTGDTTGAVTVRVQTAAGIDINYQGTTFADASYKVRNAIVRTNVAAGGLKDVVFAHHAVGPVGVPVAGALSYTTDTAETAFLHIPAVPNGRLVIYCHGHGGTPTESGWSSGTYKPAWDYLISKGYTIAVPAMGGNLWGNDTALQFIADLHAALTEDYDLDPRVYLWGYSMGATAVTQLIAEDRFPVAAAFLGNPALDLDTLAADPSYPTVNTSYPVVADRDAHNALKKTGAAFRGVPFMIAAASDDTVINPTTNADALVTLLTGQSEVVRLTGTGGHVTTDVFRGRDAFLWFEKHAETPTVATPRQVERLRTESFRTFARVETARPTNRFGFIGDSTVRGVDSEIGVDGGALPKNGDSWPTYASILSGQRILKIRNAGDIGDQSGPMLARIKADVLDYLFPGDACVIYSGTNDVVNGVTYAAWTANMIGMVDACRVANVVPILCTVLPSANSALYWDNLPRWNEWVRTYGPRHGVPVLDLWRWVVDPATSGFQAALTSDGVHPSPAGALYLGQKVADALTPSIPISRPGLIDHNRDSDTMIADPLNLGAVTSGLAAGWAVSGSTPSGMTFAVVTDAQVPGKMQQVISTASAGAGAIIKSITSDKWSVGDRIMVGGVVTTESMDGNFEARVWLSTAGGSGFTATQPLAITQNVTRGQFWQEIVVPPGTTSMSVLLRTSAGGTGTFGIGQLTIKNLTKMGVMAAV